MIKQLIPEHPICPHAHAVYMVLSCRENVGLQVLQKNDLVRI